MKQLLNAIDEWITDTFDLSTPIDQEMVYLILLLLVVGTIAWIVEMVARP